MNNALVISRAAYVDDLLMAGRKSYLNEYHKTLKISRLKAQKRNVTWIAGFQV